MTISKDINVYFHMKNHYRKLKNVKSTIDNSPPKGFAKLSEGKSPKSQSEKNLTCASFEGCNLPNSTDKDQSQKEDCPCSALSSRSLSLPPRPLTRRHPCDMPDSTMCTTRATRAQSFDARIRKCDVPNIGFNNMQKHKKKKPKSKHFQEKIALPERDIIKNESMEKSDDNEDPTNLKKQIERGEDCERKLSKTNSSEEHEYLQFLLRITEDIITHDFLSSSEIHKVFRSHIEANKDRLDVFKMQNQIEHLCKQLNIPLDECYPSELKTCKKRTYATISDSVSYSATLNNSTPMQYNFDATKCECGIPRQLIVGNNLHTRTYEPMENGDHFYNNILPPGFVPNGIQLATGSNYVRKYTHLIHNEQETLVEKENSDAFGSSILQDSYSAFSLSNNQSLGRVTERTEPSSSDVTLHKPSPTRQSDTTVSSFGILDVLPGFENLESAKMDQNLEKKDDTGSPVDIQTTIGIEVVLPTSPPRPASVSSSFKIAERETARSTRSSEVDAERQFEQENLPMVNVERNSVCLADKECQYEDNFTYDKKPTTPNQMPLKTSSLKLKLNNHEEEYVLVPGPIYLPKSIVVSSSIELADSESTPICTLNFSASSCAPVSKITEKTKDLLHDNTKLLSSDYDLTPERDNSHKEAQPNVYHTLMVDASTSATESKINDIFTKSTRAKRAKETETFLLNDDYLMSPYLNGIPQVPFSVNYYMFSGENQINSGKDKLFPDIYMLPPDSVQPNKVLLNRLQLPSGPYNDGTVMEPVGFPENGSASHIIRPMYLKEAVLACKDCNEAKALQRKEISISTEDFDDSKRSETKQDSLEVPSKDEDRSTQADCSKSETGAQTSVCDIDNSCFESVSSSSPNSAKSIS